MNRRAFAIRTALASLDFAVILFAFWAASLLNYGTNWLTIWESVLPRTRIVVPLYAAAVVLIILAAGLYRPRGRWSFATELHDMGRIGAGVVVLTMAALYLFKLEDVSRQMLGAFFLLTGGAMFCARAGWRLALVERRRRGRSVRRLLIVGSGPEASTLAKEVQEDVELGIAVAGFVNDRAAAPRGYRWLGTIGDLAAILSANVVDEVAICLPLQETYLIDRVVSVCREQGKDVRIPVRFMDGAIARGKLEQVNGLPVLSLLHTPGDAIGLVTKRVLDVIGAAFLLALAAPLMFVVAAAVVVADGRPVMFKQTRGGIHGREFKLYKFRTMVRDAEALLAPLIERNERTGPVFKMSNDPRVTQVGRLLRRTSLDELPQLLNVLKGDMSLVGPRPAIPHEIASYAHHQRRRLSVKPGITGLWQVTARAASDFDSWVALDLQYIDGWSVWEDVKLLGRTPSALFKSPGD